MGQNSLNTQIGKLCEDNKTHILTVHSILYTPPSFVHILRENYSNTYSLEVLDFTFESIPTLF